MFEGLQEAQPQRKDKSSANNQNIQINKYYKSLFVLIMLSVFLVWRFARQQINIPECINDRLHYALHFVNKAMNTSPAWCDTLTGIGQFVIDSWFLFMTIFWYLFEAIQVVTGKEYPVPNKRRHLLSNKVSVSGKGTITQQIQKFPFPHDIVWRNPGFFSITVPYDRTRDFFYSGHTGVLVVAFCQLYALKMKSSCIICGICIGFIMVLLLSTQVHYTADVFGGFFMGLYVHGIIAQYVYYSDYVWSLPYMLGCKLYKRFKNPQPVPVPEESR